MIQVLLLMYYYRSVNSTNSLNYGLDIIVIHGAGSFGHFQAHEYGVSKGGIKNDNGVIQWKKGFAMTRDSVTSLNRIVVHTLVHQCNLPAVGVSPFPNGKLLRTSTLILINIL